eukprot:scaffold99599_cov51-Prasinocladus_malaysianus.AAC.1
MMFVASSPVRLEPGNWYKPQNVTVKVANNYLTEPRRVYNLTVSPSATDGIYSLVEPKVVSVE